MEARESSELTIANNNSISRAPQAPLELGGHAMSPRAWKPIQQNKSL